MQWLPYDVNAVSTAIESSKLRFHSLPKVHPITTLSSLPHQNYHRRQTTRSQLPSSPQTSQSNLTPKLHFSFPNPSGQPAAQMWGNLLRLLLLSSSSTRGVI